MGDFSRGTVSAAPAADTTTTGALPVKPATYVVDTTDKPLATSASAPGQPAPETAASFPNLNQVPEGPKSKLLTPEEKAKVIADLEALAKSQAAAVEKSRKATTAQCGDAVKNSLDPEAKLKAAAAGQGC
jgi:hypothetical protein